MYRGRGNTVPIHIFCLFLTMYTVPETLLAIHHDGRALVDIEKIIGRLGIPLEECPSEALSGLFRDGTPIIRYPIDASIEQRRVILAISLSALMLNMVTYPYIVAGYIDRFSEDSKKIYSYAYRLLTPLRYIDYMFNKKDVTTIEGLAEVFKVTKSFMYESLVYHKYIQPR